MSPEFGIHVWEGLGPVVGRGKWGMSNIALGLMLRDGQHSGRHESWLQSPSQNHQHQHILIHRELDWCLIWRSHTPHVLME